MDESLQARARQARPEIVSGALRGERLLDLLRAVPVVERDAWIDALLGLEEAPPDGRELPRGAVPYLPCGVDEIVAMVTEAPLRPSDLLVDLGSGVGRMVMLAHLLSGARAHGIEIQDALVRIARARCDALALGEITFAHRDASDTALEGSAFFLYAPFTGPLLPRALGRIEEVARRRPIVVGTAGFELRDVRWLTARTTSSVSLTLYDSCHAACPRSPPR